MARKLSFISLVAISLGFFFLVLVSSVMGGMNQNIGERIFALVPHVENEVSRDGSAFSDLKAKSLPAANLAERSSEITEKTLSEHQDILIRNEKGFFRGALAKGWDQAGWREMSLRALGIQTQDKNQFLSWAQFDPPPAGQVDVGFDLAQSMGIYEGDLLTVFSPEALLLPQGEVPETATVTVRHVFQTALTDLDSLYVYYSAGLTLKEMESNPSRVVFEQIWLKNPLRAEQFRKPEGFTWGQKYSSLFAALKLERLFIGLFLAIGSLVAVLSVLTVMLLLVTTKRKEIGILRAMGLSELRSQFLFWKVGVVLGAFGVFTGSLLGLALSVYMLLNPVPTFGDVYFDSVIPVRIDAVFLTSVLILGLLVVAFLTLLSVRSLKGQTIRSLLF